MFVYELSGCGFASSCSNLNFRFRACFEQGVPWHSGNYRVWIHSETRTWHDKNIQSEKPVLLTRYFNVFFTQKDSWEDDGFMISKSRTGPANMDPRIDSLTNRDPNSKKEKILVHFHTLRDLKDKDLHGY